jgi:hypothetical protein
MVSKCYIRLIGDYSMGNYLSGKPVTKCTSCSKYKDMLRRCKIDVNLLSSFNDVPIPEYIKQDLITKYRNEFKISPNTPVLFDERSKSVSSSRNGSTRKYR